MTPKVERAIQEALRDLPDARVELSQVGSGRVQAAIRTADRTYRVTLLWAGQGWPSEVQRAVSEVKLPWPRQIIVAATNLSPGSLALLRDIDANWVDEAGRARLVVPPGLSIARDVIKSPHVLQRDTFRWNRSAIELTEFVLHSNSHELRTGDLASATGWSPGQVSQILSGFEDLGWTERRGGRSGRQSWHELVTPGVLLDAWAEKVSRVEYNRKLGHRTDRDLLRFANMVLGTVFGMETVEGARVEGIGWCLTTWAGLQMITPYATTTPALHVYVQTKLFRSQLERVMREAEIREVDEGARIEFWEADFKLLTQPGKPNPLPVASTPRLYADLFRLGGRAADAAQHLRETVLGY